MKDFLGHLKRNWVKYATLGLVATGYVANRREEQDNGNWIREDHEGLNVREYDHRKKKRHIEKDDDDDKPVKMRIIRV